MSFFTTASNSGAACRSPSAQDTSRPIVPSTAAVNPPEHSPKKPPSVEFDFEKQTPKPVLDLAAAFAAGEFLSIRVKAANQVSALEGENLEDPQRLSALQSARAIDILVRFELAGAQELRDQWFVHAGGAPYAKMTSGLWDVLTSFREYFVDFSQLRKLFGAACAARMTEPPDECKRLIERARGRWAGVCDSAVRNGLPTALRRYFAAWALPLDVAARETAPESVRQLLPGDGGVALRDVLVAWGVRWFEFTVLLKTEARPKSERIAEKPLVLRDSEGVEVKPPPGALTKEDGGALKQLFGLVGLADVKRLILRICDGLRIAQLQKLRSVPLGNFAFIGNPGTGKTVCARLFAQILCEIGALPEALDPEQPRKKRQQPPDDDDEASPANQQQIQNNVPIMNYSGSSGSSTTLDAINARMQQNAASTNASNDVFQKNMKKVNSQIAQLQPPPSKVPMTADAVADVKAAIRATSGVGGNQKAAAAAALVAKLRDIQDEFERGPERIDAERGLKARARELDSAALPPAKSNFLETTGSKLASMGRDKAAQEFAAHRPGVVFIDEAYQLNSAVLELLLTDMENYRAEQVFILAGYKNEIDQLIKTNPGFPDRVSQVVHFSDYTPDELHNIFLGMVRDFGDQRNTQRGEKEQQQQQQRSSFRLDHSNTVKAAVARISAKRGSVGFGNARAVRNFVERMMSRQRVRLSALPAPPTPDQLYLVTEVDALGGTDLSPLTGVFASLNGRIGIAGAKQQLVDLAHRCLQRRVNERRGDTTEACVWHRVITGSPGCGKTKLAEAYAELLYLTGQVEKQAFVSVTAMELKGDVVGASRTNVDAALKKADGGVLFIDEAYDLMGSSSGGSGGGGGGLGRSCPYMEEVVSTLVGRIQGEPTDRVVLILAGYAAEMQRMLDTVNPGLKRRMQFTETGVHLPDFTEDELFQALLGKLRESKSLDDAARKRGGGTAQVVVARCPHERFEPAMARLLAKKRLLHFGNMGEVQTIAGGIVARYMKRQYELGAAASPDLQSEDIEGGGGHDDDAERHHQRLLAELPRYEVLRELRTQFETALENDRELGNPSKLGMCFAFLGQAGTGKTSAARCLGAMLKELGVLSTGTLVERSVSSMQTGYAAQAGLKTREMLDVALGGVLFIDEAYRLFDFAFGKEILDELVQACTEEKYKGKVAIVLAGYPRPMRRLFKEANPGLRSRFEHIKTFAAWDAARCVTLFHSLREGARYEWDAAPAAAAKHDAAATAALVKIFQQLQQLLGPRFASGRTVESVFENCKSQQRGSHWTVSTVQGAAKKLLELELIGDESSSDEGDDDAGGEHHRNRRAAQLPQAVDSQTAPTAPITAVVVKNAATTKKWVDVSVEEQQQQQQQEKEGEQDDAETQAMVRQVSMPEQLDIDGRFQQLNDWIRKLREAKQRAEEDNSFQAGEEDRGRDGGQPSGTVTAEARAAALKAQEDRIAALDMLQREMGDLKQRREQQEQERLRIAAALKQALADENERLQRELEEKQRQAEELQRRMQQELEKQARIAREQLEAERLQERKQEALRSQGPCPAGFPWRKLGDGTWICGGGTHTMRDDDIKC